MRAELLIAAPKLLQACFAASTDFFTYKLASSAYGKHSKASPAALVLTVLSPWQAFCSVRTLSNSIETTLTILALYLWPWESFARSSSSTSNQAKRKSESATSQSASGGSQHQTYRLYEALAAAALACILRPTNIIIWAAVSTTLLFRNRNMPELSSLAQAAVLSGSAVLAVSVGADRSFYNEWMLPPLRFLQFNLVQSLAVFYGRNRPDYYLTEGLPLLLTTALPFAAVGMWKGLRATSALLQGRALTEGPIRFTLAAAVIATVATLSLISHKEVRFIYPLLPMLHILAAEPFAHFFVSAGTSKRGLKQALLVLLIAANIVIGWYTLFVHQRGVIDVLHFLRQQHEAAIVEPWHFAHPTTSTGVTTVGFLMPCHSTPWRSHLVHTGIQAWALTCEPPLNLTLHERETYMDEADIFYDDPRAWLASNLGTHTTGLRSWPEYLVFFEQLEPTLIASLNEGEAEKYKEIWRGFNTHWHDDWRRKGDIVVWRREAS